MTSRRNLLSENQGEDGTEPIIKGRSEEKKVWDEEKKFLNEQINREKI